MHYGNTCVCEPIPLSREFWTSSVSFTMPWKIMKSSVCCCRFRCQIQSNILGQRVVVGGGTTDCCRSFWWCRLHPCWWCPYRCRSRLAGPWSPSAWIGRNLGRQMAEDEFAIWGPKRRIVRLPWSTGRIKALKLWLLKTAQNPNKHESGTVVHYQGGLRSERVWG